jgi:hypothetical protein
MQHSSRAQDELTWAWYSEDDEVFSLTELEEKENILRRILSDAQIEVVGVLNPMIVSRVMELMDLARQRIVEILSNLKSSNWLSPEEIARLQSIPQGDQFDVLLSVFKERIALEKPQL